MPVTPSKGATMRRRAAVACDKASLACDTCRLAALSSTDRWLMNPCPTSSWLRLWLAWAMDNSAWLCCTWARCNWSSNCTSNWPLRTRSPSRKLSWVMRPPTSGRITTLWRDRRLPTAWASSARDTTWTFAASTAGGRAAGPAPDAAAPAAGATPAATVAPGVPATGGRWYHHAAPEASAIPRTETA